MLDRTVKAIIFDIGGVLAKDIWENLYLDHQIGLASLMSQVSDTQLTIMGKELWQQFACISAHTQEGVKRLEQEYWSEVARRLELSLDLEFFIGLSEKFIKPIEGMFDLLRDLHSRGIILAICSDNTEFWFRRQYVKLELAEYFREERIALSCRVGVSKMSPGFEMFKSVCKATSVQPQECILIDDRPENVIMANDFGMRALLFPANTSHGRRYLELLFRKMNILG
jgi:HAD superfamily hydrolase (TIGR01509 family)